MKFLQSVLGLVWMTDRIKCVWVIRPGTANTFWAYTPCKRGFNYLSRVRVASEIRAAYDGRICPICGKVIECNMALIEELDNDQE